MQKSNRKQAAIPAFIIPTMRMMRLICAIWTWTRMNMLICFPMTTIVVLTTEMIMNMLSSENKCNYTLCFIWSCRTK